MPAHGRTRLAQTILVLYGDLPELPSGSAGVDGILENTNRRELGASEGTGSGASLRGGSRYRGAQRALPAIASTGYPGRAWGAKRERSASTHATPRRQFISNCRARARVEMVNTWVSRSKR
eukprot:141366-Pleurochrysis_carterae.AAC.1